MRLFFAIVYIFSVFFLFFRKKRFSGTILSSTFAYIYKGMIMDAIVHPWSFNPDIQFFIGQAIQSATKMTGAALGAIGTAVNNKKYNKINDSLASRKQSLTSIYRQQMAQPYTSTAAGANAARQMQQGADKAARAAGNRAIRTGQSAEAQVAAASAMQEANANAIANLAAQGTSRQDALQQQMLAQTSALDDQINANKVSQIQASNQAWGALAS